MNPFPDNSSDHRMNGDLDTLRTIANEEGVYLKAYNTTDSIRIAWSGPNFEASAWVTREQALEFIALLSVIVCSGPTKPEKVLVDGRL